MGKRVGKEKEVVVAVGKEGMPPGKEVGMSSGMENPSVEVVVPVRVLPKGLVNVELSGMDRSLGLEVAPWYTESSMLPDP